MYTGDGNILASINIWLSEETLIQRRIVYDLFMMFGDVGGLNDFFDLFLMAIFGFFSQKLMMAFVVSDLFHGSDSKQDKAQDALESIKPLHFPVWFTLLRACTCGFLPRNRA